MKGDDHADGGLRRASLDSGAGVSERQAQLPSTSYPGSSWLNGFSRLSTHNESGSAAAGANEGESSPAAGWLKKQHAKEDSTRAYFDLPKSETLLDEFVCALQKRVLLQGRIYIFERHVCFSSNVFGYVKKKARHAAAATLAHSSPPLASCLMPATAAARQSVRPGSLTKAFFHNAVPACRLLRLCALPGPIPAGHPRA